MNSNGKTSSRISLNDDDGGGGGESVMSMSFATCAFSCVVGVVSSPPHSSVPSKSASFLSKSRRVSSPV